MSERGLHLIEDDLSETWIADWAAVGFAEIDLAEVEAVRARLPALRHRRPIPPVTRAS